MTSYSQNKIVIAGGGGHALEVYDELLRIFSNPSKLLDEVVCFDQDVSKLEFRKQIPLVHSASELTSLVGDSFAFCLGVGRPSFRRKFYDVLQSIGGVYYPIRAVDAVCSEQVSGKFDLMTRAFVGPEVKIGLGSLINVGAHVHHECVLGDFVEVGPSALILGNARIGEFSQIGAGAVVLPGVSIGKNCIVGAGAIVTKDIQDGSIGYGVPFKVREIRQVY